MNKMLTTSKCYFWIVFIILLVACGTVPSQPTVTLAPTSAPTSTSISPTSTASPTTTFIPAPSPVPRPRFSLDGYLIAFVKNGDLYFQVGNDLPLKLTNVGEKSFRPEISPDNKKILFARNQDGKYAYLFYTINTDGTDERIVIPNDWRVSLASGIKNSFLNLAFIPYTHQLLLNIYMCASQERGSPCSVRLFIVDTDTGNIKKLADLGLAFQQNSGHDFRTIQVSPDGKLIAVGTQNGIDIFTLDGKIIRKNILPYKPVSYILFPALFWLPDSSGLTVALPERLFESIHSDNVPGYTTWRYSVDRNVAVPIHLEPPLMGTELDISPDGKWSFYGGYSIAEPALYLGDLTTGSVQIFDGNNPQVNFSWGPDSRYFIYQNSLGIMGKSGELPTLINICAFESWINANHFTCTISDDNYSMPRMAEIKEGIIKIYDLGFDKDIGRGFIFIKPK